MVSKVDGTTITINSGTGVISGGGGGASITVADTPPTLTNGAMWFDTVGTQLYIGFNDGTSTQWVQANNLALALPTNVPPIVVPPLAASWTQRNIVSPAGVADVANGVQIFETPASATPSDNIRQLTMASPSTPYTIDALLSLNGGVVSGTTSSLSCGIFWTDGTKLQMIMFFFKNTAINTVGVYNFSSPTAFVSTVGVANLATGISQGQIWTRLADNGTTVSFSVSSDGVSFVQLYSVAKASGYLGASGYTNIGFFGDFTAQASNTWQSSVTLRSWWVH